MRHYITLEIEGHNAQIVDPNDEHFNQRSKWSYESFLHIASLLNKGVSTKTLAEGVGVSEGRMRMKISEAAVRFLADAQRSFKLAVALKVSENDLRDYLKEIKVDINKVCPDAQIQTEKPQKTSGRKKTYDPTSFLGVENRLVDVKVVSQLSGLGQSTIHAWVKKEKFPKPIRLSATCVRWKQSDIHEWIKTQASQLRGLQ